MAKRKTRNKSFAQRRAQEAAQRDRADQQRSLVTWLIGSIAVVGLLVLATIFLPDLFAPDPEPSVSGDGTESSTGSASTGSTTTGDRAVADLDPAARNNYYSAPPEMVIDTSKSYEAIIETNRGTMRLELFDDEAPVTVNNFVFLANQGFYDGTVFHRVINQFMAQGGDPTGTGTGGPGYRFEDEFVPELRFDRRGLLAMANSGPATNGSQFFITFVPTPHLNDAHTIFGEIIEGDDVLGSITIRDPGSAIEPDEIVKVEIVEK